MPMDTVKNKCKSLLSLAEGLGRDKLARQKLLDSNHWAPAKHWRKKALALSQSMTEKAKWRA